MKKTLMFATIVCVGLALGMVLRQATTGVPDRAQLAVDLFAALCTPLALGGATPAEPGDLGLVRLENIDSWADERSQMLVEYSGTSCSVSDILTYMSPTQRADFDRLAAAHVATAYPMLKPDLGHGLNTWDRFEVWAEYGVNDPRRWAVILSRFSAAEGSDAGQTTLLLRLPASR